MKPLLLSCLFLCFATPSSAQDEPIDQFDPNGKKHGKWHVYLTERWKEVKTPEKAAFYRFTYYDHGVNIYPIDPAGVRKPAKLKMPEGQTISIGNPIPLNGTYEWYDPKGTLRLSHRMKDGEFVGYWEYRKSGQLYIEIDHSVRYMEQPHTYAVWITDRKGNRQMYFHQKLDKLGWVDYEAPKDHGSAPSAQPE